MNESVCLFLKLQNAIRILIIQLLHITGAREGLSGLLSLPNMVSVKQLISFVWPSTQYKWLVLTQVWLRGRTVLIRNQLDYLTVQ